MKESMEIVSSVFDVQECEFEWDDDIDLNQNNCTRDQMDEYFK